MIDFDRFTLSNGLKVLFHKSENTPMAVVNILYDVGAKDELDSRTGFAHLFEHLMFGGSVNIADFDGPLQLAGGQSNAFTSNDITNYYDVLPAVNLESALWLESDRMLSLAFSEKSLRVQKDVVVEEFKQRYLNQPYGDVWHVLRKLAYVKHPYQWPTIGENVEQIETANLDEVKAFFNKHYNPQNAILCIAGNFDLSEIKTLVNKYFSHIPAGEKYNRNLVLEPVQNEYRTQTIVRDVPNNGFYYAFKMPGKFKDGYFEADLISDALGRGKTSRLYQKLKTELNLVSEISAYILGSHDTGLLIVSGFLSDGISFDELENNIWDIINDFLINELKEDELKKIINKFQTTKEFSEIGVLSRAMALCEYELIKSAEFINEEFNHYNQITPKSLHEWSKKILKKENCSTLFIQSKIS